MKFNGILGKTEKFWEKGNKNDKKLLKTESNLSLLDKKDLKNSNKDISNNYSTNYYTTTQTFSENEVDKSFNNSSFNLSNEDKEKKINNFIKIIETKLGKINFL